MTILVVGYGSIGRRHTRILTELGHKVAVVSSQNLKQLLHYRTIASAIANEQPSYVVIANNTNKHYDAMIELAQHDFKGILLVEKPLFHKFIDVPQNQFQKVYVAYNLRFHPLIQKIKSFVLNQKILSVHAYAGQYLPDWRPQTDYRLCYSSHKSDGGGVLRDLSHELDYITWILGGWKSVVAMGGKYSCLEIDSDDIFSVMLNTPRCPIVFVHVNYLDKIARRQVIINTNSHTIELDLINGRLSINQAIKNYTIDRDYTYRVQHQNILEGKTNDVCSWEQGIDILKLIQATEESALVRRWITNE